MVGWESGCNIYLWWGGNLGVISTCGGVGIWVCGILMEWKFGDSPADPHSTPPQSMLHVHQLGNNRSQSR